MGVRGKPGAWAELYSSARWQQIRRHQLQEHPLCKYCAETRIVEPATICDHVEPHHGDVNKFWSGPFQSLCKRCHDSAKHHVELHGARWLAAGPAASGLRARAISLKKLTRLHRPKRPLCQNIEEFRALSLSS
jgi:5-methylcytosine-specific restriction endonuclease McrA